VVDYPDYAARAVRADEQAERSLVTSLADSWRRVAKSYWALARQHTEMKYQREFEANAGDQGP
jgi:hypothetical protein